jgi:formylmethanofuran dehydrogenase subunit E
MSTNKSGESQIRTIKVVCERCKEVVPAIREKDIVFGIFDMTSWAEYRRSNERYVCPSCMYADPNYVARYGSCF